MKVSSISFAVVFSCLIGCLAGCGPSELQVERSAEPTFVRQEDFRWPEGKRAAISLTFDDARLTQIDRGIPILDEYRLKGTFYVSMGNLEQRLEGWKKAVSNGHEIANHSVKHPCSGNFPFAHEKALEDYTLDMMRSELEQASADIEQLLGVKPVSFAYPCGQKYVGRGVDLQSYVPLVAEKFMTGRGWPDEWANDPAFCDMAQLMGVKLDEKSFDEVKTLMDRTLGNNGWLVFCSHEVAEDGRLVTNSQTLKALCEYARDPKNGIWLDTVENIATYILEQRNER